MTFARAGSVVAFLGRLLLKSPPPAFPGHPNTHVGVVTGLRVQTSGGNHFSFKPEISIFSQSKFYSSFEFSLNYFKKASQWHLFSVNKHEAMKKEISGQRLRKEHFLIWKGCIYSLTDIDRSLYILYLLIHTKPFANVIRKSQRSYNQLPQLHSLEDSHKSNSKNENVWI